ncbi:MAG: hypothetical protein JWM87_3903 [Candidatus Eremiobacteraeota bacterium]|nr:hypothetical protein [Candidatus Eremiobacteraeota bacterium]
MEAAGRTYAVELKKSGRSSSVAAAVFQVEHYRNSLGTDVVPLLFVDRMSPNGAALCAEHRIDWIDADGNAEIQLPDLRVRIRGVRRSLASAEPEGFNAFSRTASRVSHVLLLAPGRKWTRAELARETQLDKGSLSRIIRALSDERYVNVEHQRRASVITVASWSILLDAWAERYRPAKPVAFGLVSSRSGEQTLHDVERRLSEQNVTATFTGLPAAAYYARFGSFRRVRLYLPQSPDIEIRRTLNVADDVRGRNVAICVDDGRARIGRTVGADGVTYASPVLAYLDLRDEPERAAEAAESLRRVLREMWINV